MNRKIGTIINSIYVKQNRQINAIHYLMLICSEYVKLYVELYQYKIMM